MASNPQGFFRFAAQHYSILEDLYYRGEGVNEAELQGIIMRSRQADGPSPLYLIEQLQKLGIIEPVPGATATFELTRPVYELLRYLLQEHRLTSVTVLQAYLDEMDAVRAELEIAINNRNAQSAVRALNEISEVIERLRHDSRANREAVLNKVLALKSNRERLSSRERFEIINHLWTKYLEPLRDIIDVRKAMDAGFDSLDRLLVSGVSAFSLSGEMVREFGRARARLLRLRRDTASDFRESLKEVLPLYESLRRENEIVRGASLALERMRKEGLAGLGLDEMLAIPAWKRRGLISDLEMESFLYHVRGYEPGPAPGLPVVEEADAVSYLDPEALLDRIKFAMPVQDLLRLLLDVYGTDDPDRILKGYGLVYNSGIGLMRFGDEPLNYHVQGMVISAYPLSLEKGA